MSDEILVNVTPRETRVAVVENGVLQEVHIERANRRGLVGTIIKGRVLRVLPGMQAAFVDIGLEKAAFLHASDVQCTDETQDITTLVKEGQDILVQIFKDPLSTKGARLTTQLSLASRYLVFMPQMDHVGLSLRLTDEHERTRLQQIVEEHAEQERGGFIIRTNAEGASDVELIADMQFLYKLWQSIEERMVQAKAPDLIYEDLPLVSRTMRDMVTSKISRVRIDSDEIYQKVCTFVDQFVPQMTSAIEKYQDDRPIFDLYAIEEEIQRTLAAKVYLKSGGSIVIEQTEAMTTIDVNTGAFVGHRNLDETIYKTNLEATEAIGRQLRLRNLGGIIIIDFIDMRDEEHKNDVLSALKNILEKDPLRTTFSELSDLGLVEVTRKRTRDSLEHWLCEPCSHCFGRGFIKSAETVCYEIFRDILRQSRVYHASRGFLVTASQAVVDVLLDEESSSLAELEALLQQPIKLQAESLYRQDQYNVVML